jgi:hypothetical protein
MQLSLALILLITGCIRAQFDQIPVLGGINEVNDVDDESIRDTLLEVAQYGASRIAIKRMPNLPSSRPVNYAIIRVISAKTQVVAGNFNSDQVSTFYCLKLKKFFSTNKKRHELFYSNENKRLFM